MGKNRWRKKAAQKNGARQLPSLKRASLRIPVTVESASITPQCPGMERPGLDGIVFVGIQRVDALVRDMRHSISVPNGVWDEATAVKRYLAYLSILVDITLSDITMSAVHANDVAVMMKARMLVEYANKALYFSRHPDYALYMTTIHEAKSVRNKIRDGGGDANDLAAAEQHLAEQIARFSRVEHLDKLSLAEIMRQHTRDGDRARNDEYVWLYGAPSAVMHGDPEGMRFLMPVDGHGHQHPTISLSDAYLNALCVDAGSNALIFCDTFIDRFHPGDQ